MKTNHQLLEKDFFIPNWDCKTIVLGTFNPEGGEPVNYFYGRITNFFWRAISLIDNKEELFYHNSILNNQRDHFKLMKDKKFGCADIIKTIEFPDEIAQRINGGGYPDQVLFRKNVIRYYNFDNIKNYIAKQNQSDIKVAKIINTVGNRFDNPTPKEFSKNLNNFKEFCKINNIEFISSKSASQYAVNTHKTDFEKLKDFYRIHLFSI